ncbi:hypothetical protein OIU92_18065 [Escherichia coli]|nr:hypothetical protein [Escherichia coli]
MHTCNVREFSLSSNPMPPELSPTQHCASPEPFRLAADFTIAFTVSTRQSSSLRDAFQLNFFILQ